MTTEAQLMWAIDSGLSPFELQEHDASFPFRSSVLRSTWNMSPSERPTAKEFVVSVQAGLNQDVRGESMSRNRQVASKSSQIYLSSPR